MMSPIQQPLNGELFVECLEQSQDLPNTTQVQDLIEELKKQEVLQIETITKLLKSLGAPEENIHSVETKTKPELDEEQIKVAYSEAEPAENEFAPTMFMEAEPSESSCWLKMAAIIGDCIGFLLAAMGIFPVVARRVGIALAGYQELERVNVPVMRALIREVNEAQGLARAQAVLKIAKEAINSLGTGLLLRAIANEMKWYDWVATSIWFAGELAAWLLTDGLALAGQVLIIIGTATFFIIDIRNYVRDCS